MSAPRILIAGIGNIFFGDDVFGVEVAQRLLRRPLPEGVRVVDFGIRGLDLAYALLLDTDEEVIFVDAVPRSGEPGTVYLLEIDGPPPLAAGEEPGVDTHNVDLAKVLRLAAALGCPPRHYYLVGCEPRPPADPDDMTMEMSDAVRAAVDEAIPLIESLAARLQRGEPVSGSEQARSRCTNSPSP